MLAACFKLPLGDATVVENIEFHDHDSDSGNDWTSSISEGVLTWETDSFFQNPDQYTSGALAYGELINFRFDANAPQQSSDVQLDVWQPLTIPQQLYWGSLYISSCRSLFLADLTVPGRLKPTG